MIAKLLSTQISILILATVSISACDQMPSQPNNTSVAAGTISAQPTPYTFVNLADEYERYWDESANLDEASRIAAFKVRFEPLFPGFFSAERIDWMTSADYDEAIGRSFERFPKIREDFTQISLLFPDMLETGFASFVKSFPDVNPIGPIYLVHSFGEMDGGTRQIGGSTILIFGADVMAQVHTFANERPFFHHEFFHVYHSQAFKGCEEIWCALWSEGLAVLAAKRLNPLATEAELLLTSPAPIVPRVNSNLNEAVCSVRSLLSSTSGDDYSALFGSQQLSPTLPARFGYYVGYLVALEAEKIQNINILAHLSGTEVRPIIDTALTALAVC